MTAALIVGCGLAGAAVATVLPVDVVASPDGRTVAEGPVRSRAWSSTDGGGGP